LVAGLALVLDGILALAQRRLSPPGQSVRRQVV
jgi:hypothetical protein